jgi:preprotein translocase subunit SecA
MLKKLFRRFMGDRDTSRQKTIKHYQPQVNQINEHYEQLTGLSDEELRSKTDEFRQRLEAGESTDDIMCEAFAVVKQACKRLLGKKWKAAGQEITWNMVPYDVQLIGAVALHEGRIAEMATGEGKTLVATMPLYLNALSGNGAHLITVNDYLAQRDAEWMGEVYRFLGLTVGKVLNGMPPAERVESYHCDITYGTNSEFGFDYLRDNMVLDPLEMCQPVHNYAIVDEVDSVLIDEARTPLIIAGPVEHSTHQFGEMQTPVEKLVRDQRRLISGFLKDAHELMKPVEDEEDKKREEKRYRAGVLLLKTMRGAPKNSDLTNWISEDPSIKILITKVENDFLREKSVHLLDEELFFSIDEKSHIIDLSEMGRSKMAEYTHDSESMFVLPDISVEIGRLQDNEDLSTEEKMAEQDRISRDFSERSERIHNISQLLRAYSLFEKDVEYVVQEGKVQIVDEFTGRIMFGRRFSEGLHQAIEAKEHVRIQQETQTVASITLQNFFRMYSKLAGMTGTAATEADEFFDIYGMEVVVIPTNEPINRLDNNDLVYKTKKEKMEAAVNRIAELHRQKLPVLVGTASVDVSQILSKMLKRDKIPHNVLNAKQHHKEALIIARAGEPGAVTIATNMAGRGTDIKLGGGVVRWDGEEGDKANASGGLQILGTERHESRRIDLQLRGRSGRQGDPGTSDFFLSLEDDLMRLFGSDKIAGVMDRLGVKAGEVITHSMITKSIERAQMRVEEQNFVIRKHLLEYDDVMNQQRKVVYKKRRTILEGKNLQEFLDEMVEEFTDDLVDRYTVNTVRANDWNWDEIQSETLRIFGVTFEELTDRNSLKSEQLLEFLREQTVINLERKRKLLQDSLMDKLIRFAMLTTIDHHWKEHLHEMDMLKEGIGFQAYAQKNPLTEYKKQSFDMFTQMLMDINRDSIQFITRAQLEIREDDLDLTTKTQSPTQAVHRGVDGLRGTAPAVTTRESREASRGKPQPVRKTKEPRPNEPCPCGSGKKYKQCHGKPGS